MIEIPPSIAAIFVVILAIFLWRVVFGIPFIYAYGVGQRKCKITDLFFGGEKKQLWNKTKKKTRRM